MSDPIVSESQRKVLRALGPLVWFPRYLWEEGDEYVLIDSGGYIADHKTAEEYIARIREGYDQLDPEDIVQHNKAQDKRNDDLRNKEAEHKSPRRPRKAKSVYIIQSGRKFKVGVAADPQARMKQLQISSPDPLRLIHASPPTSRHRDIEAQIHNGLSEKRIQGEWFALSDEDIADIMSYLASWVGKD